VRVCFLSPGAVPVEHASALEATGVEMVVSDRPRSDAFDAVVACSWRLAGDAFRMDASVRALLLFALEHRALPAERPERLGAVAALDLPLELVTTSAWLDAAVAEQHPHAHRHRVPLGHYDMGGPQFPSDETAPLQIAGAPRAVLEAMTEPWAAAQGDVDVMVTLGEPLLEDPAAPSPPTPALAPILTAFSSGATCVAVPTEGRDELVRHRETGLVVDPDDPAGAAAALDELVRDRALLASLKAGAVEEASRWPSWEDAGRSLRSVLETLVASPPAYDGSWPAALMADVGAEAAKLAAYESQRMEEMRAWAARIEAREAEVAAARSGGGLRSRLRGS
jgi:hypothetical protein